MRLVFRPGSVDTKDVAAAGSRQNEDHGYVIQPSLTISSVHPGGLLRPDLDQQNLQQPGKGSTSCQLSEESSRKTTSPNHEQNQGTAARRVIALLCSCMLLASMATVVLQAQAPRDCVSWSEKRHVIQKMKNDLTSSLIGQDLATDTILTHLSQFLSETRERRKPLVLLFYGPSGSGKTFAGEIIGQALMPGASAQAASQGKRYAIPDYHNDVTSENNLSQKISTDNCLCSESNVFLLDDLDLPTKSQWLQELAPLLSGDRQSYSWYGHCPSMARSIVILTMQVGTEGLIKQTERMLQSGVARSKFPVSFQASTNKLFSNASSGHKFIADVLGTVDALVPFLPLQAEHVAKCVTRELRTKRMSSTDAAVKKVLSLLEFANLGGSAELQYALYGCKHVTARVAEAAGLFDLQ